MAELLYVKSPEGQACVATLVLHVAMHIDNINPFL